MVVWFGFFNKEQLQTHFSSISNMSWCFGLNSGINPGILELDPCWRSFFHIGKREEFYTNKILEGRTRRCVHAKSLSLVWLSVTPWTVAHQTPLSMEVSRQEYWSGLPFSSPGDLLNPGIKPRSPTLQANSFSIWATRAYKWVKEPYKYLETSNI